MLSNDVIFGAQIITIVTFVFTLFGLYRLLVSQKDAVIQLLKERLEAQKEQLEEMRSSTPDVLAQSLSDRINLYKQELERMREDKKFSQEEIRKKEDDLRTARQEAEKLSKQAHVAKELLEEFSCPHCGAVLEQRQFYTTTEEHNGREYDVDREFTRYECGYEFTDSGVSSPCPQTQHSYVR